MKRVAIIDLGSNTGRLVAFDYQPGRSFRQTDELRQVVRLSQGMGEAKIIRAEPFERGIDTLKIFRSYCDAVGIVDIRATATSAVREAANGDSFLAAARERAGIDLDVLSGEREARLGAVAVANSLPLGDGLVLDLGGGSVELALMRDRRVERTGSWPLGAVATTDAFFGDDPPDPRQAAALAETTRDLVRPWMDSLPPGLPLVGVGGTVRNLARIQARREGYPVDLLHHYTLTRAALREIVDDLLGMDAKEREGVAGLNRDRADIIAAGGVVVREIVELAEASGVVISRAGLREGLLYSLLLEGERDPFLPDVRAFSVLNLMRQYYDHEAHNRHVETLSLMLFDQLAGLHGYGRAERELLSAAALLHDIGMAIDYQDHHKHGLYLVMGRPLPGFDHREQVIIALLVRYHRKSNPSDQGLGGLLRQDDMRLVERLAGLLRLAEYLERSKAQKVRAVRCHLGSGYLQIEALSAGDARVEVIEAGARSDLLADVFKVVVEVVERSEGGARGP